MHALRFVSGLGFCLAASASVGAGTISLPADVSVNFTAEPDSDLQSGQRIAFMLSVTNHGPEPAARISFGSSPIRDELDLSTITADCGNTLGFIVVDLNDGFYYEFSWAPTLELPPLQVGETRTCHFYLDYTEWAADTFPLTFDLRSYIVDLDASNNSATVTLQRAPAGSPPVPLPSISIVGLLLLAAALVGPAVSRIHRTRRVEP